MFVPSADLSLVFGPCRLSAAAIQNSEAAARMRKAPLVVGRPYVEMDSLD